MRIEHLSAVKDAEKVSEILDRDGAVIINKLVSDDLMDRFSAELDPWTSVADFGVEGGAGDRTRRTGGLVGRSKVSHELITNPLVLGTVGEVLRKATAFQLHLTQIIAIHPGEMCQQIHRDQWGLDYFPFPIGYEVLCNTLWAMTEFTEKNGATRIVVGSNKMGDGLEFEEKDSIPAEMEKGSVLIYTGSVYHGGGANRSDSPRCAVNIGYSAGWLRQEENQYLSTSLETARTLPVDILHLMGYRRGAVGLGYVDDMRDPIEVVRPDLKGGGRGFGDISQFKERMRILRGE